VGKGRRIKWAGGAGKSEFRRLSETSSLRYQALQSCWQVDDLSTNISGDISIINHFIENMAEEPAAALPAQRLGVRRRTRFGDDW
jgi:hypothetical protein